ncbi:hypothetical protein BDZ89DRAFT_233697 [Hymenopellis radicata]|nr:hypothetical protein BDZ89DRAFT_233697 [Hymenopellis radicata]
MTTATTDVTDNGINDWAHRKTSQRRRAANDSNTALSTRNRISLEDAGATVGDARLQYSHIYCHPEGLYVAIKHKGNIKSIISNSTQLNDTGISLVMDVDSPFDTCSTYSICTM